MLRKFEWIRDGGYFADFRSDLALPDFQRINVIYGHNGSGKSSLARVLFALGFHSTAYSTLSVVVDDAGTPRATNGRPDPVFDRILVFNEDFVAQSHRFGDGLAEMNAVLTLGQRSLDDLERLERLRGEQKAVLEQREKLTTDQKTVATQLDREYSRVAQAVVDDLVRAGGIYASRGHYSTAKVRNRFEELRGSLVALDPEELAAKRQLIRGTNKEKLPDSELSLSTPSEEAELASELLAATPVTIMLDTIMSHPAASRWVQDGVALHVGSDCCAFCGGSLSAERLVQIERHFNFEVKRLQGALGDLIERVQDIVARVDLIERSLPAGGLIFEDLRILYDGAAAILVQELNVLRAWCEELAGVLERKKDNVLAEVAAGVGRPPTVNGTRVKAIIETHNARVNEYLLEVQGAARDIELHHLCLSERDIAELTQRQSENARKMAELTQRSEEISIDIQGLETPEGDPVPSAAVLTREVGRLLGRNELHFEAIGDKYRVLRNGVAASRLSIGEKTAITLVHFLETVARFDAADGKPIVVIDDPVSSLDSNVFMGISTYIWSAVVSQRRDGIGQLFLLTHNFDLFRQWDIQLEALPKKGELRDQFGAALFELQSRHVAESGAYRRRPVLASWPDTPESRKKLRSSYHHAFLLMANAYVKLKGGDTLENRLDAQLLFPNVIRRVLESFLAFKVPNQTGNFTAAMRSAAALLEAVDYEGDSEALRQQLTRFAHTYSHSETPDTNEAVNPDEIFAALAAVFQFMHRLDDAHFCGLCEVVGFDSEIILGQ